MNGRLCIFVCHNFRAETAAAVAAEGWPDVVVAGFVSRCGRPPTSWDELREMLADDCTQVAVLGRACIAKLGAPPADFPPTRVYPQEQCFHLIAASTLVNEAISDGAYLMTPAWLAQWRNHVAELGFSPDRSGEYFKEFARELVLLDTGIDPAAKTYLSEFSATVGLPARRMAVGLDHVRLLLARIVLEWRQKEEQRISKEKERRHAGELADHISAMDMLTRLAKTQNEEQAIASIEELFSMLFAPKSLHYLRVEHDIAIPDRPIPEAMLTAMHALREDHAYTPDGCGFLLRIVRGDQVLGLIAIDGLAFAQYRQRYLNMALAVTGVCGLVIENARNRRRLLEAEKMASLSILVAGVAHEINTPLGVGLTAASTLQQQSRKLTQNFAERSMTQSDLTHYLDTAASCTGLILGNLERIGQLVDAFRQVAVGGKSDTEKHATRLRDCIAEVIRSLGDRFPADRIAVNIQCEADLEITSQPGDWASIFTNLIGNSLKHGFKGRERGIIDIEVVKEAHKLRVDYRDDGVGMAPESLARVFDPFYTTDLQQGMGLGMHLVFNLITHRMGGSIECESPVGHGIHFHIEIPQ